MYRKLKNNPLVKLVVLIARNIPFLRDVVRRARGDLIHSKEVNIASKTIGTEYGGHTIYPPAITSQSVIYSFGIGNDASFDIGLINEFGCTIFAFDPTPESAGWVKDNIQTDNFKFMQAGIAEKDGIVEFSAPDIRGNMSYFKVRHGQPHNETVALPVYSLKSIMKINGHSAIDVLKMDIEGFEYEVINSIIEQNLTPNQLLIEFHHGMYGFNNIATISAVDKLKAAGYYIFHVSPTGHEYSFIRSGIAE